MATKAKNAIIKFKPSNEETEYFDWSTQCLKPMSENLLNRMAVELYEWAEKDSKALTLTQFYTKRGIDSSTWQGFLKRSKNLAMAQEMAKSFIADRREVGAIENRYNAATIMPYMSMYKQEYKDHAEWRAKLNKENNGEAQNIRVVIERFPETNIVPPKAIED